MSKVKGLVAVAGTDPLAGAAAAISQLMSVEVEWASGIWSFTKKRRVGMKSGTAAFCWTLPMEVSFYGIQEGRTAVNMAEVFLLTEEVAVFTSALRHATPLLPVNYLEQMTKKHETCCLQIESLEPAEEFVGRLIEAFQELHQQVPIITRNPS